MALVSIRWYPRPFATWWWRRGYAKADHSENSLLRHTHRLMLSLQRLCRHAVNSSPGTPLIFPLTPGIPLLTALSPGEFSVRPTDHHDGRVMHADLIRGWYLTHPSIEVLRLV